MLAASGSFELGKITCIVSSEAKKTIPGALVLLDKKMHRMPAKARFKTTFNDIVGCERVSVDIKRGSSDCSFKNTNVFVSCKQNRAATDDAAIAQPIPNEISKVVARSSKLSINKGPIARPKNRPPAKDDAKRSRLQTKSQNGLGSPSTTAKRRDREEGVLRSAAHLLPLSVTRAHVF
jgi:hypothetical protein